MEKEEVEKLEAGRELDGLVAEKVMGWKKVGGKVNIFGGLMIDLIMLKDGRQDLVPHYSTDIAAAWEVLEKMRADCGGGGEPDYIMLNCYKELEPTWYCAKIWAHHDGDIPEVEATANTAPLAICRAALLATCA